MISSVSTWGYSESSVSTWDYLGISIVISSVPTWEYHTNMMGISWAMGVASGNLMWLAGTSPLNTKF